MERRCNLRVLAWPAAFAGAWFAFAGPASAAQMQGCETLVQAKLTGIRITSAEVKPLGSPTGAMGQPFKPPVEGRQYCKVNATVRTKGVGGHPDAFVTFEIGLPDPGWWNGKYLYQGPGGHFGYLSDYSKGLLKGYASATGTSGWIGKNRGSTPNFYDAEPARNNLTQLKNMAGEGQHAAIAASKAVAAFYYRQAPRLAYYYGCSGGGKTGLTEAQRYPRDFDGIIAGAAFSDYIGAKMQFIWNVQIQLRAMGNYIPASKTALIARNVYAQCDSLDGLTDGLIDDPRKCKFDPGVLQCTNQDGPQCLTAGQVDTLRKFYGGLRNSKGEVLAPPEPFGGEAGPGGLPSWLTGMVSPSPGTGGRLAFPDRPGEAPLSFISANEFFRNLAWFPARPDYDIRTFDFDKDPATLAWARKAYDATDPDLSAFVARKGKLIQYHGWGDLAVNPLTAVAYWNSVQARMGDSGDFYRLFMVPGMNHCGGGPGPNVFDALSALEAWVEQGVAPASMIATHYAEGSVDRTRPLCPFPQIARYTGMGSIDDARNFRCQAP